jgi:phage terminase large subunit-like protein
MELDSERGTQRAKRTRPAAALKRALDKDRSKRIITFIEALTIPSGHGQGKLLKLQPWQKQFIRDIYEPHVGGKRVVRRAILSLARKNGKTCLIAAIALAHLVGPEREVHGEIYSAANDREQASIVFKFARQMVDLEPELAEQIEIIPSTKTMLARATGSIYRAISAEAGTKHGFLPSVVIYDELAQAKNRDLYDVLDTSFGARSEPLFIAISTQSNDPEHILSKLIDDGLSGTDPTIVCHLHAADEGCELDDEVQWKKANPALDVFRDREDLAAAIRKAIRMPAEEPKTRNLLLNQRVSPVSVLISRVSWQECLGDADLIDGEEIYAALDLSSVNDLTALVIGSADDPCRIMPVFWKPIEWLVEHSTRDFGSGSHRYEEWVSSGHLRTTPGRAIDHEVIARFIADLSRRYRVRGLAYDRWRMPFLLKEFDRVGLAVYEDTLREDESAPRRASARGDGLRLVPWGQGFKDAAPAVDALMKAIDERKLVHAANPCLTWNIANAIAVTDAAGNRKLDKSKVRFRIDGAVALAMMMGLRARDRSEEPVFDPMALIG